MDSEDKKPLPTKRYAALGAAGLATGALKPGDLAMKGWAHYKPAMGVLREATEAAPDVGKASTQMMDAADTFRKARGSDLTKGLESVRKDSYIRRAIKRVLRGRVNNIPSHHLDSVAGSLEANPKVREALNTIADSKGIKSLNQRLKNYGSDVSKRMARIPKSIKVTSRALQIAAPILGAAALGKYISKKRSNVKEGRDPAVNYVRRMMNKEANYIQETKSSVEERVKAKKAGSPQPVNLKAEWESIHQQPTFTEVADDCDAVGSTLGNSGKAYAGMTKSAFFTGMIKTAVKMQGQFEAKAKPKFKVDPRDAELAEHQVTNHRLAKKHERAKNQAKKHKNISQEMQNSLAEKDELIAKLQAAVKHYRSIANNHSRKLMDEKLNAKLSTAE